MEFVFTTDQTWRRADEIVDYVRGPRLWMPRADYPDFDDWADRAGIQLRNDAKRAVIALSAGSIVGAAIYQRHRQDPSLLEIKNITVRPDARGRHVASFLLRNAEVEGARDYGVRASVVDAKARNVAIRSFLVRNGYLVDDVRDLYGLGSGADVVYRKLIPAR